MNPSMKMEMKMKTQKPYLHTALILTLACIVFLGFAGTVCGSSSETKAILSWQGDAGTTQTIVWQDENGLEQGYVRYVTEEAYDIGGFTAAETRQAVRDDTYATKEYIRFEAYLIELTPGQTYYYQVGAEGAWSQTFSFKTAPPEDDDFTFLYIGDVQFEEDMSAEYAVWGDLLRGAYSKFPETAFGILGGDLVNNGQSIPEWKAFLQEAGTVFSQISMMSVPGNHECNAASGKPEMYLKLFAFPENGPEDWNEEFYSFDYGDAHFTMLNSSVFLGEQNMTADEFTIVAEWIRADLAASGAKWKIVVMHHPAYSVVNDSVADRVMSDWTPIFEEAGGDLVFCGHQHVYMRTAPMYEGQSDPDRGVTYIMGNSGSKHYAASDVTYAEVMIPDVSTYQMVNVSGDLLEVFTYDSTHKLVDSFVTEPKNRSTISPEPGLPGDINGDGVVDYKDVRLVIEAIHSRNFENMAMDIDGNGVIDIRDAHLIALMCR